MSAKENLNEWLSKSSKKNSPPSKSDLYHAKMAAKHKFHAADSLHASKLFAHPSWKKKAEAHRAAYKQHLDAISSDRAGKLVSDQMTGIANGRRPPPIFKPYSGPKTKSMKKPEGDEV